MPLLVVQATRIAYSIRVPDAHPAAVSPAVSSTVSSASAQIAPLIGPIRGNERALEHLNERSEDAHTLHRAIASLRLFGRGGGRGGTQRSDDDHPVIGAVLEWRDRYLASVAVIDKARRAIEAVAVACDAIEDDRAAANAARDLARATSDIAKYELVAGKMIENVRDAVQEAMSFVSRVGDGDGRLILEDIRRVRTELELERKKLEAGVIGKVTDALRVSAGALMAERRRRAVGMPAGAVEGPAADEEPAAPAERP